MGLFAAITNDGIFNYKGALNSTSSTMGGPRFSLLHGTLGATVRSCFAQKMNKTCFGRPPNANAGRVALTKHPVCIHTIAPCDFHRSQTRENSEKPPMEASFHEHMPRGLFGSQISFFAADSSSTAQNYVKNEINRSNMIVF